jgi:hypothetical protein
MNKNENIIDELNSISNVVANIDNNNIFEVPNEYFNNLSNRIISKISLNQNAKNEITQLSPLLSTINKAPIFEVPNNYFDLISHQSVVTSTQKNKPLGILKFLNHAALKYAIAASIVGCIAFGSYKIYLNQSKTNVAPTSLVAKLNEKQLDDALAIIDDDDIINYLKINTDSEDIATLTDDLLNEKQSSTDEDYLTDDLLLDNFVNEKDTNNFKN